MYVLIYTYVYILSYIYIFLYIYICICIFARVLLLSPKYALIVIKLLQQLMSPQHRERCCNIREALTNLQQSISPHVEPHKNGKRDN